MALDQSELGCGRQEAGADAEGRGRGGRQGLRREAGAGSPGGRQPSLLLEERDRVGGLRTARAVVEFEIIYFPLRKGGGVLWVVAVRGCPPRACQVAAGRVDTEFSIPTGAQEFSRAAPTAPAKTWVSLAKTKSGVTHRPLLWT